MNKKIEKYLIVILIELVLVSTFSSISFADNYRNEASKILRDANDYISRTYNVANYYPEYVVVGGTKHYLNLDTYHKYKVIAYYSHSSLNAINIGNDIFKLSPAIAKQKKSDVIYRYIGYDRLGRKLYNDEFPADTLSGKYSQYNYTYYKDPIMDKISKESKHKLISNIMSSSKDGVLNSITRYYDYKWSSLNIISKEHKVKEKYKDWYEFLQSKDRQFWETHIQVASLPSSAANGSVVIRHDSYYFTIPLIYEGANDERLHVKHVVCSQSPMGYIKSYQKHFISNYDYDKFVNDNSKINITANEIASYRLLGYKFFDGDKQIYEGYLEGDQISGLTNAKDFTFKYQYTTKSNDSYLVFFYEKENIEEETINATGKVNLSSKQFRVEEAIPSSENIKVTTIADKKFIYNFNVEKVNKDINIEYIFDSDPNIPFRKTIPYTFNWLNDYYLFVLDYAKVNNYKVRKFNSIYLKNQVPTTHEIIRHKNHSLINFNTKYNITYSQNDLETDYVQVVINMPDATYVSMDEKQNIVNSINDSITVSQRNDKIKIDNKMILDDSYTTSEPTGLQKLENSSVTLKKIVNIDKHITNGMGETTAELKYKYISGSRPTIVNQMIGNNIVVFTPVYNGSKFIVEKAFDQRPKTKQKIDGLALDHIYKLDLSSYGRHIASNGYKTRDYNKYAKKKIIICPFDVFASKDKNDLDNNAIQDKFLFKKGEKIIIDGSITEIFIRPAYWEQEGLYKVKITYVAQNADEYISPEEIKNIDIDNNAAEKNLKVDLVGRLFDFVVENIDDMRFETEKTFYNSGRLNKEGKPRNRFDGLENSNINNLTLPVVAPQNAERTLENSVKLGYQFLFSVKTMGNFKHKDDIVIAKPKFVYISKDGAIHKDIKLFTKVGAKYQEYTGNTDMHYESMSEIKLDNLKEEVIKTSSIYDKLPPETTDLTKSIQDLLTKRTVFRFKPDVSVSTSAFRIFIPAKMPYSKINKALTDSAVQKWLFSYSMPNSTVAFLPDENGKISYQNQLKDGYIGVGFDIIASKDNNENGARLVYKKDKQNEWKNEGYNYDGRIDDEVVIFYNLSKKASDDFKIN